MIINNDNNRHNNYKNEILIVEDERKIRKVIRGYLEKEGFMVKETSEGKKALEIIKQDSPSLVILDLMLPDTSGENICQLIRQESDLPVLMLTAKSKTKNKIKGLKLGADDYLVKPFDPQELIARIKAILRRSGPRNHTSEVIILGQDRIKIYPESGEVKVKNKNADLTGTEFKILYTLIKNPHQILTRYQLADRALGLEFDGYDRTIDVHIKNIRQKLKLKKGEYIHTVYGQGYKYVGDQVD